MAYDFNATRKLISKFFPEPVYKIAVEDLLENIEKNVLTAQYYNTDEIWRTTELREKWLTETLNVEMYMVLIRLMRDLLFSPHSKYEYTYSYMSTVSVPDEADPTKTNTKEVEVNVTDYLSTPITEVYEKTFRSNQISFILSHVIKFFYMINVPEFHTFFPEFSEIVTNRIGKMSVLPRNYLIARRADMLPHFEGEQYSILEDITKLMEKTGATKGDLAIFYSNNISIIDRALRKVWAYFEEKELTVGNVYIPLEDDRVAMGEPPIENPDPEAPPADPAGLSTAALEMADLWMNVFDASVLLALAYSTIAQYSTMSRAYNKRT